MEAINRHYESELLSLWVPSQSLGTENVRQ